MKRSDQAVRRAHSDRDGEGLTPQAEGRQAVGSRADREDLPTDPIATLSDSRQFDGTVGPYELVRILGRGTCSIVFEAVHQRSGRRVTLKVLRELSSAAVRDLEQEIQTLTAVRHRTALRILDCGATKSGNPYLVRELLSGDDLPSRLRRGPLELPEVLRLSRSLASGMAAFETAGRTLAGLEPRQVFLYRDWVNGEGLKILSGGEPNDGQDPRNAVRKFGSLLELVLDQVPEPATTGRPHGLRRSAPIAPEQEASLLKALSSLAKRCQGDDSETQPDSMRQVEDELAEDQAGGRGSGSSLSGDGPVSRVWRVSSAHPWKAPARPTRGSRRTRTRRNAAILIAAFGFLVGAGYVTGQAMHRGPRGPETSHVDLPQTPTEPVLSTNRFEPTTSPLPVSTSTANRESSVATASTSRLAAPESATVPDETAIRGETQADDATVSQSGTNAAPTGRPRSRSLPSQSRSSLSAAPSSQPSASARPARPSTESSAETRASAPTLESAFEAYARGDLGAALDAYRALTGRLPNEPRAWRGLGVTAARAGVRGTARRALRRYLELAPGARDASDVRDRLDALRD